MVRLTLGLDGALALVSGRTLKDLDRVFAPLRLCAAAVYGCESRQPTGCVIGCTPSPELTAVSKEVSLFVKQRSTLFFEDKGASLAVHFDPASACQSEALTLVRNMCKRLGPTFYLQAGKNVSETRRVGFSKGAAIRAFMRISPFAGRTPVFVGNDVGDEGGFAVVNALCGVSIRVGEVAATLAQYRLQSVRDVFEFLRPLALVPHHKISTIAGLKSTMDL